jgi:myosin heavy subunit
VNGPILADGLGLVLTCSDNSVFTPAYIHSLRTGGLEMDGPRGEVPPNDKTPPNESSSKEQWLRSDQEDWLARTKYELAESVETRVWASIKSKSAILGIAVGIIGAFLTFIGGPLILEDIASRVKGGLDQEENVLRQRVREDLANMEVETAHLKGQAQTAQNELSQLHSYAEEFSKLSPQYEALKKQVDGDALRVSELEKELKTKVEQAGHSSQELKEVNLQIDEIRTHYKKLKEDVDSTQTLAVGDQLRLASLSGAVLSTGLGGPAIVTGPSVFSQDNKLSGFNFGSTKGHVYVQVVRETSVVLGQPSSERVIELEDASVMTWQENSVTLQLSSKDGEKLRLAETEAGSTATSTSISTGLPNGTLASFAPLISVQYQIQTATGEKSNWYSSPGVPLLTSR